YRPDSRADGRDRVPPLDPASQHGGFLGPVAPLAARLDPRLPGRWRVHRGPPRRGPPRDRARRQHAGALRAGGLGEGEGHPAGRPAWPRDRYPGGAAAADDAARRPERWRRRPDGPRRPPPPRRQLRRGPLPVGIAGPRGNLPARVRPRELLDLPPLGRPRPGLRGRPAAGSPGGTCAADLPRRYRVALCPPRV